MSSQGNGTTLQGRLGDQHQDDPAVLQAPDLKSVLIKDSLECTGEFWGELGKGTHVSQMAESPFSSVLTGHTGVSHRLGVLLRKK